MTNKNKDQIEISEYEIDITTFREDYEKPYRKLHVHKYEGNWHVKEEVCGDGYFTQSSTTPDTIRYLRMFRDTTEEKKEELNKLSKSLDTVIRKIEGELDTGSVIPEHIDNCVVWVTKFK